MRVYELRDGYYRPTPEYLEAITREKAEQAKLDELFTKFEAVVDLAEISPEDLRTYVEMLRAEVNRLKVALCG